MKAQLMNTTKKLVLVTLLAGILIFMPFSGALADEGRYFVKSNKNFWKNALGSRHNFNNGFSVDLSDFQVRFARLWGLEIEPVEVMQILPEDKSDKSPNFADQDGSQEKPDFTATPKISGPKDRSNKGGGRPVPSDQTPWGIETVYNNPAITQTAGGAGVKVVVLDTGISTSHPDLKRRIGQCKDFTNPRFPIVEGKCEDKNGHGTHVSGIIAADSGADNKGIFGVAPEAKLFVYKVCGSNGSCYADDIATALRTAADQGANVANMSFGSDSDVSLIRDAVNYAASKGVLLVAAAGNDGPEDGSIDYPGAYAEVVAAGAISQSIQVTSWSSRGINITTAPYVVEERDIEFATPGENIESTWLNGGYAILSGTSMASPFAAGLAAKFWQATVGNPAQATRDLLHTIAIDLLPAGDDNASGFGLPRVPATP